MGRETSRDTLIMSEEMVTITKKEYDDLLKREAWLLCLEAAGVDNWQGYDYAQEMLEESKTNS